jgi:hypothetical protein
MGRKQTRTLWKQAEKVRPTVERLTMQFHKEMLALVSKGEVSTLFGDEITVDDFFDFVVDNTQALNDESSASEGDADEDDDDADAVDAAPKRARRR